MGEDPFVVRKCVLFDLRPELFLPENRPILINTRRVLRVPGGDHLAEGDRPSWIQACALYLSDSSDQQFTEFDFVSRRPEGQGLSVFSLLVNAELKLRNAFALSQYPNGLGQHVGVIVETVKAIFFVPLSLQNRIPSLVQPVPSIQTRQPSGAATQRLSSRIWGKALEAVGLRKPGSANPQGSIDRIDVGAIEGDYFEPDVDPQEPDYNSKEDESDDEPGMINGLNFSEMETVLQRASDGSISAEERAEAAMLMLGMAGGESMLLCTALLSLSNTKHQVAEVNKFSHH